MPYVISTTPSTNDQFVDIRAVLLKILPAGVEVIQAQINRTPEPASPDFVLMTPLETPRLGTNYDSDIDCVFSASIASGGVMSVTSVDSAFNGKIPIGGAVFGVGLDPATSVTSQTSGVSGGVGTYIVDPPQIVGAQLMAAGTTTLMQPTGATYQLDVHGPNSDTNAQIITTIFRDEIGVKLFEENNASLVPLYCEDPRQLPFINENSQIEDRFVITARFEVDVKVVVSQQFAGEVSVTIEDVSTFPTS